MTLGKERLDKLLVELNLVESREKAQALIMAGKVIVNDHAITKAGQKVLKDSSIRIKENLPYVSRGGLKLKKALDEFLIDVKDKIAIDVGASTGGFTDCLLQSGVKKVFAVDVGYNQLAWKLRQDLRVINLEKVNIRYLTKEELKEEPDIAVIDASFISLEKILPNVVSLIKEDAEIIALIKPQFEVGKGEVGKGGVVKDEALHEKVKENILSFVESLKLKVIGLTDSPIYGADGNKEFLIALKKA